ncbi:hypothetical protein OF83DRAFT_1155449 [Amylostereum chailletii]|nr:hypothetical protein OF83DRAFT_1155449 [Amylostereum chailletii]
MELTVFSLIWMFTQTLLRIAWLLYATAKTLLSNLPPSSVISVCPILVWLFLAYAFSLSGLWRLATSRSRPRRSRDRYFEIMFTATRVFGLVLLWDFVGAMLLLYMSRTAVQNAPDIWLFGRVHLALQLFNHLGWWLTVVFDPETTWSGLPNRVGSDEENRPLL